MPVLSAGLLLYRVPPGAGVEEVLLAHMGRWFWARTVPLVDLPPAALARPAPSPRRDGLGTE